MLYWLKQSDPDTDDLNQIGLTLRYERGEYFVEAIAAKDGRATVRGVSPGDELIRVGNLETQDATWGAIYDAMHGKPGQSRDLLLERAGQRFTVAAEVTPF